MAPRVAVPTLRRHGARGRCQRSASEQLRGVRLQHHSHHRALRGRDADAPGMRTVPRDNQLVWPRLHTLASNRHRGLDPRRALLFVALHAINLRRFGIAEAPHVALQRGGATGAHTGSVGNLGRRVSRSFPGSVHRRSVGLVKVRRPSTHTGTRARVAAETGDTACEAHARAAARRARVAPCRAVSHRVACGFAQVIP